MKDKSQGILISLEGIDGSGKSSLASGLSSLLRARGEVVVLTREPGGTPLGKTLYGLLQDNRSDFSPEAEYLLFAADRAQHMQTLIKPALANGAIVISDRMADSSLAYQGYGRGLDKKMIETVNRWAMQNIEPNITFYLRISAASAGKRLHARNEGVTRFEKEKEQFWLRVIEGYEALAKAHSRICPLDAELSPDMLVKQALEHIDTYRK